MNEGFSEVSKSVQPVVAFRYDQFQAVGELVVVSVKVTLSGSVPEVGEAEKSAAGVSATATPQSTINPRTIMQYCRVVICSSSWHNRGFF